MKLLTKELIRQIPGLYETEKEEDPICHVKLFNPTGAGIWYITEYSKEEQIAFGYVVITYPELGYFSLEELRNYKGPLGIGIERDLNFKPTKLSEVKKLIDL